LDGFKAPRGRPDPENDLFSAKSKTPSAKSPYGTRRLKLLESCTDAGP